MACDLSEVVALLSGFARPDLTQTLAQIEAAAARGITAADCVAFLENFGAEHKVLTAAAELKRLAGQVNVTIHSLGILLCLPHILETDERVEYLSLGAGNTGREFDLETNRRVAEFKFIRWRGGPESIRQNSIFKDFFLLAENETAKRKYLYLLGTEQPLRFLRGGRALNSVLSLNEKVRDRFFDRFSDRFRTVRDYYTAYREAVFIEDVSRWLPELAGNLIVEEPTEEPA